MSQSIDVSSYLGLPGLNRPCKASFGKVHSSLCTMWPKPRSLGAAGSSPGMRQGKGGRSSLLLQGEGHGKLLGAQPPGDDSRDAPKW